MTEQATPFARLDRALDRALSPWNGTTDPITILFSGGVDSGLLAWELRRRPSTDLFTIGTEGSSDLVAAGSAARAIELPWSRAVITPADLAASTDRHSADIEGLAATPRSIFLSLAIALERTPARSVLCGQGADELFLGYAHFRGLDPAHCASRAAADLERLQVEDWPRTLRIAERVGRRIHAPFLDPGFVREAASIPLEDRLPTSESKGWWRAWARARGLPREIADRPKRALQYGSGIASLARHVAPWL